jgi:predicted DNA-binding transcriptional regulator AlpA
MSDITGAMDVTTASQASALLKSRDVAQLLGVSSSSLSRWRSTNTGPTWINLNGNPRYRREDLKSWIEKNAQ